MEKLREFSEKKGVLLYLFERLRASEQEYKGSGAEGFFCKNYTADRYLRSTAVESGSDGPDLIWDLDRLFTIGRSGPDLESGSPVYDRTFHTRSGI